MHYTIYKITNNLNQKFYIGKHQTKDLNDGYMGSGKLLKRAIQKYGIEFFTKEILFIFETEQEMNQKEKELVVLSEQSYNLCPGGKGGFGYINSLPRMWGAYGNKNSLGKKHSEETKRNLSKKNSGKNNPNYGKKRPKELTEKLRKIHLGSKRSLETKKKISLSHQGFQNSQYGTIWITDGTDNKKIQKNKDQIPEGWRKGRFINKVTSKDRP